MSPYFDLIKARKYEDAKKLMASFVPGKLYKFVSLSNDETVNNKKLKTLEEAEFWVSAAEEENDPYDFQAIYVDRAKLAKHGWTKVEIDKIANGFDIRKLKYVGCLTANDEQFLPMWAYYTNGHQGFCVEYDVIASEKIHKVSYENTHIGTAAFYVELLEAYRTNNESDKEFYTRLAVEVAYVKHKTWEFEKEFRVLYPRGDSSSLGQNIPLDWIGLRTSKIIAGVKCLTENTAKLRDVAKAIGADYKQAKVSETTYGIEEE